MFHNNEKATSVLKLAVLLNVIFFPPLANKLAKSGWAAVAFISPG